MSLVEINETRYVFTICLDKLVIYLLMNLLENLIFN